MIFQQTIVAFPHFLLFFLKTQLKRKFKMHVKKILKIITDILMFVDFIFLMSHEVVRNLSAHGVFGIALFALFILHHVLNGGFYRSLNRGKYNSVRILFSATAWLLFALMILMAFSSVMMSGAIFTFSSINMTSWSRPLHTFSCSWGFLVMGFHLGLHLHSKLKKIENAANDKTADNRNSVLRIMLQILWLLIFTLGIFCIVHSQLYVYLFWQNAWKLSAPNIFISIVEYLGMTAGLIVLSHFVMSFIQLRRAK